MPDTLSPHQRRTIALDAPKVKAVYPSWRYHPDGRAVVVEGPDDEADLGPEWTPDLSKLSQVARDRASAPPVPVQVAQIAPSMATHASAEIQALTDRVSALERIVMQGMNPPAVGPPPEKSRYFGKNAKADE